jgi:hypothetical protein
MFQGYLPGRRVGIAGIQEPGAIRVENIKYQIQHATHDIFHTITGETDLGNPIQNIQESKAIRNLVWELLFDFDFGRRGILQTRISILVWSE